MGQGLDDEEDAYAAVRAESHDEAPGRGDVPPPPAGATERHRSGAQLRLKGGERGPVAGREDAVVADVDEAEREDVQGVAPYELLPVQRHGLLHAPVPVVLVQEGDAPVADGEDAPVADGHAVGVAREVLQRALRAGDRGLCVDHPGLREAGLPDVIRDVRHGGKRRHVLGPEHHAKGLHGEQERLLVAALHLWETLPLASLLRPSSAGDDAVQVGMEHQGAAPGVQQGCHAELDALLPGESPERVPCRMEERRVGPLLVAEDDAVQRVRQGEYHVEVRHGEEFLLPREQPRLTLRELAARTVPVTATVVEDVLLAAFRTYRDMAAKGLSTAVTDMLEHGRLVRGGTAPRGPRRSEPPQGLLYSTLHGLRLDGEEEVGGTHPTLVIVRLRYVQVSGRGLEALVAQPLLDVTDVHPELQHVGGVGMPEDVAVHVLDYARAFDGPRQDGIRPLLAHVPASLLLENVFHRAAFLQISPHHLPHVHGERHVAVLAALASADVDDPPVEVQVAQAQGKQFPLAHARVVTQADKGLLAKVGQCTQKLRHLPLGQHNRKGTGLRDAGIGGQRAWKPEHIEVLAHRIDGVLHVRP